MKKYIFYLLASRLATYLIALISSLIVEHGEVAIKLYERQFAVQSPLLFRLLRPLLFYDGDYFLEIALTGYNYDKIHAFFPGFPLAVKFVNRLLTLALPVDHVVISTILAGWLLNLILSVATIWAIKRMFETIPSAQPQLKDLTLKIFIVNPLNIYLSSFYSESLFLFTQAVGLLIIAQQVVRGNFAFWKALCATTVFALGGFVRSNGFLSGGFVIYFYVLYQLKPRLLSIVKCICAVTLFMIICVLPFAMVQYTGYKTLCASSDQGYDFCQGRLPSVYGYVQKKYWDVYFLSMIAGRKLSNVVFVLPILVTLLVYAASKLQASGSKSRMLSLLRLEKVRDLEDFLVPNVYLFALLIGFGLTVMHYNSFTRLLAGYPFFYVFLAELYTSSNKTARAVLRFWLGAFQILVTIFAVNYYVPI